MKISILFAILLTIVGAFSGRTLAAEDLEISIAIPKSSIGERVLRHSWGPGAHFPVIITNTTDHPQRIWQDWCSWGYYALSFEVTDQSGKTWTVSKKMTDFTRNFPAYWILDPHDSMVIEVAYANSQIWNEFPQPTGGSETVKMRAIFEVKEDESSRKNSVWTGRVASRAVECTFYH